MIEAAIDDEIWKSGEQCEVSAKDAVVFNSVSLRYGGKAASSADVLSSVRLQIQEGEFVCILGPSGCGKTSLLKLGAGYEKPTEGEVTLYDQPHPGPNPKVGVVFQHANLFPWLSVNRNVQFGLKMLGLKRAERSQIAAETLNQVGLSSAASLLPHQLSGGMKQRAAIARALAANPALLLMDEPFAALDAITRESLQYLLRKLWIETGKTIVFITHDVEEALLLGSRLIVMKGGPGRIEIDMPNSLNRASEPFAFARQHLRYGETREQLLKALRPSGQGWQD
ncbi:ABC transporter ATP-binding protein [Paenibacillus sp. NPDC058174]|uniref:ABC transporter ATP-binding protein n=1 Tax=Paenibacillus sp. NPDC058174 TaxID=3346366 RepID=UPI0036D94B87